jgi:hypothetical protein
LEAAAQEARSLVFGETPVPFPLDVHAVRSYAEAKERDDAEEPAAEG